MAISLTTALTVLAVIAHPDDELMYSGLIHTLTHQLGATVDLVCVTNGEGGFTYSGLSESLYGNLQLSNETIGRKHLPRIRQQELFASGRILGIRKFFFYDQVDLKYDRDVSTVFATQWDKEWVIEQFQRTIKTGNGADGYDLMLIVLPSVDSHGHHSASALLALEAINRLQRTSASHMSLPTVLGSAEFIVTEPSTYPGYPIAEILENATKSEFRFNLKWKINKSPVIDYKTIRFWIAGEHKSQGSLINDFLTHYERDEEQYFYFAINERYDDLERLSMIENLFDHIAAIHETDASNTVR